VADGFVKESSHLAMDDIKDSIAEMLYYREHVLKI
jgi:oligoribonuclease